MELSGPLYRRTSRLFNPSKPGDWSLVWCELVLEQGELVVSLDRDGSSKLATIRLKDCDLAHVRSDGRDCFEIALSKSKKETFSSHESSHDVDWWMSMLVSVKRDLELGIKPRVPIVCMPTSETTTAYKSARRQHSTSVGNAESMSRLSDQDASNAESQRAFGRRQPSLVTSMALLERFTIYETPSTYYVVCSDRHYSRFRLLELNRMIERPSSLQQVLTEDPKVYIWDEMEAKLQHIAEATRSSGTGLLTRAFTAVAMVGCIRFLRGYYFTFVTQRRKIGFIGGNSIYGISATQQLHVSQAEKDNVAIAWINRWLNPSPEEEAEKRYLGLFHFLDLTKDFFFSYSYDITHTLQHNMTTENSQPSEMFTWNSYLTHELKACLSSGAVKDLVIPLVLGCYEQRKCSIFGRLVSVILLARRSRHFAGTRYLKRGVADTGMVANDVELEQIIEDENMGPGKFSSFVQHRGSIPVFWSQETSPTLPKPPIVLNRVDPTYTATQKHFADLFERYGSPIVALNLVKQNEKKEREVIVGNEYMNAVEYLNNFMPPEHRVRYVALDYSRLSGPKQKGMNVLHSLDKVAVWALGQTGVFCSAPKRKLNLTGRKPVGGFASASSGGLLSQLPVFGDSDAVDEISKNHIPPSPTISKNSGEWLEQRGVLRTNCIDCLDRTNVSQFSVGMRALGQQLYVMGIRNTPLLESRSQLVMVLMKLYSLVGDAISMQYGGSEAHKNVKNSAARENVKHRELLTSIRRYYSNSFTDTAKQDAINIFLGHFVPKEGEPPLWELESDYYLHNFEVRNGKQAVEKVRQYIEFHSEKKRTVFGEDYGMPLQLACCAPPLGSSEEEDDDEEFIDDEFEYYREVILRRDRDKRDEYIRECRRVMEEWWKEPIASFDRQKCVPPANGTSACQSSTASSCAMRSPNTVGGVRSGLKGLGPLYSDEFLHMYHPEEMTTFEKVLGYKFMNPIELSDESESAAKRRTDSAVVAHLTSAPSSSSIAALARVDEESTSEYEPPPPSRRTDGKFPTRSYRSMSAPDFGEELERVESVRKSRDSSHEFRVSESEEFLSISGADSRHGHRVNLAGSILGERSHGGPTSRSGGLRRDEPVTMERLIQTRSSHKKFIGDCNFSPVDPLYDRYVHMKESPQLWESDNESAKMYFEAYLRENNISPDDARGLREAQIRGGATFKIQTGPYTGLDQNIKARVLVAKKLKTDPDDRKIFEESLDCSKLVESTTSTIPKESMELYKSFFDDNLPEVKLYSSKKKVAPVFSASKVDGGAVSSMAEIAESLRVLALRSPDSNIGGHFRRSRDTELIPVGPLYKMDGGKDRDYILFNGAAADHAFGDVLRNETALSFYSK